MLSIFNMLSLPATDSAQDNGQLGRSGDGADGHQGFSQLLLGEKNRLSPNPELQDLAASIMLSNGSTKTDADSLLNLESDLEIAISPETFSLNSISSPEGMPTDSPGLFAFLMARAGTSRITDTPIQLKPLTVAIDYIEPELTAEQDQQLFNLLEDLPLPVLDFLKQAISELPPDHPVKQWLIDHQVIGNSDADMQISDVELSVILGIITDELAKVDTDQDLLVWIANEVQPVLNPMMMQFAAEFTRTPGTVFNLQQPIGDILIDEPKINKPIQANTTSSVVDELAQNVKEQPVVNSLMASTQSLDTGVATLRTAFQAELNAQNELSNAVKDINIVNVDGEELPELQEIRLEFLARQLQAPANAGNSNPVAISELMARQLASSPEFQSALNERIMTMVNGELKHAVIRLDPPELGALEIRIQVSQEQTSIQIISANPQVREALEAQSVRLREALAEQGLQLSNFDVNSQGSQSGSEQRQADVGSELLDSEGNPDGQNNDVIAAAVMSNRLVDDYA